MSAVSAAIVPTAGDGVDDRNASAMDSEAVPAQVAAMAGCTLKSAVFTAVTFASYGTPNGSCGAFTLGGCNASNSVSIVSSYLLGNNSAVIPAEQSESRNPCSRW